jgi:hypothetical protein
MTKMKTFILGILMVAVALPAISAPAAATFVHPRGILMTTEPQQMVIFWDGPGYYERTIAIVIVPPWYFVNELMGFDSVTVTITLSSDCPRCVQSGDPNAEPLRLLGADSNGRLVAHFSSVMMAEEDNGAMLLYTITFAITGSTGWGYYMLYLSAEATASQATFVGWDQVPVSVYPGLYLGT